MSLRYLELRLKFLAKEISPFDTGVAMGAIKSSSFLNVIDIDYNLAEAHYIEFLEEGTRKSGKHVGYISQNTVYAFTREIQDAFNNKRSSETLNLSMLAQKSKITPARQQRFLQNIAR
jgi:hypothetical protein